MVGGVGSLPSHSFVVHDGKVYEGAEWQNKTQNESFQPEGHEIADPDDFNWDPVDVDLSDQVKGFGLIDSAAIKPPDGYDDFQTYIEDWTLQNLDKMTIKFTPTSEKISSVATDAFDFLMDDEKDSMSVDDWYAQKNEWNLEMRRAAIYERRANRGVDVDPEDLLVKCGDVKLRLGDISTIETGLKIASDASENAKTAIWKYFEKNGLSDWTIGMPPLFELLSVKKAVTQSSVPSELANKIYSMYEKAAVEENERSYAVDSEICIRSGRTPNGFKNGYDLNPGVHSLRDENSFMTDIWKKLTSIDASSDASIRKGLSEFADWYADKVEHAFANSPAYANVNAAQAAAKHKSVVIALQAACGL